MADDGQRLMWTEDEEGRTRKTQKGNEKENASKETKSTSKINTFETNTARRNRKYTMCWVSFWFLCGVSEPFWLLKDVLLIVAYNMVSFAL